MGSRAAVRRTRPAPVGAVGDGGPARAQPGRRGVTERRKAFTKGEWLHQRGIGHGLLPRVRLGRGEASSERNRRLLGDTTEAVLGAVVVDGGEGAAIAIIRGWLPSTIPATADGYPIAAFNEWYQKVHRKSPPEPKYAFTGADHSRTWTAVYELDWVRAEGSGVGKREAKREACRDLMAQLPYA